MGDKQDGLTLLRKTPHGCHQLLDFLGSQHSGRLIKNQNLIVPIEHFQNVHTLLHAHGDILHLGIQVYLQPVALRQLLHLFPRLLLLQKAQLGILCAQNDIVQNSEHINQLKVLVDHTDIQSRCIIGIVNGHNLSILLNDTLLGLI